jgi:hypothetical protein
MCRRCGKEPETIQHIAAACEQLAPTECINRHDEVAKVIHQKLAEAAELTEENAHTIDTNQQTCWRVTTSNCTGIAALLRTKQYLSTDLT